METIVVTIPWIVVILGGFLIFAISACLVVVLILVMRRRPKRTPPMPVPEPEPVYQQTHCLRCGEPISHGFQFCPRCGDRLY